MASQAVCLTDRLSECTQCANITGGISPAIQNRSRCRRTH